jgi:hypothetical protein
MVAILEDKLLHIVIEPHNFVKVYLFTSLAMQISLQYVIAQVLARELGANNITVTMYSRWFTNMVAQLQIYAETTPHAIIGLQQIFLIVKYLLLLVN